MSFSSVSHFLTLLTRFSEARHVGIALDVSFNSVLLSKPRIGTAGRV
jgi:hypothetical protein